MSTSTDGMLFYGFSFCNTDKGDERPEWLDVPTDKQTKLLKESPCDVHFHCMDTDPVYYVHARQFSACRGDEIQIHPTELTRDQGKMDSDIKEFCQMFDIEYQQPNWYLASLWW